MKTQLLNNARFAAQPEFARAVVLEGESVESFNRLYDGLCQEFGPETPTELALVESMAAAQWRRNRMLLIEKTSLEREMKSQTGDLASDSHPIRTGHAFISLCNRGNGLAIINRSQAFYGRQFARSIQCLRELRELRVQRRSPGRGN